MAIIVQPTTQAELNQLVSILGSTNRPMGNEFFWGVGNYYHIFEKDTLAHNHNALSHFDVTPVNELYALLNKI